MRHGSGGHLTCPACAQHVGGRCTSSLREGDGSLRRYRKCRACGYAFRTSEKSDEFDGSPEQQKLQDRALLQRVLAGDGA